MNIRTLFLLLALFVSGICGAVNYSGKLISLKQPDGSSVKVRVFGDEFYRDVESTDGYTLVRDERTKEICYALLSFDGSEYESSGIKYEGDSVPLSISSQVKPHLRISVESLKEKIKAQKLRMGVGAECSFNSGLRSKTVLPDTVYGVTVLIDFKDLKSDITKEQIERFCNGDNYNEFGNSCSVKEYYQRISGGRLTYLNYVTDFVTLPKEKMHYENNINDLLEEVSAVLKSGKYVRRSKLTRVTVNGETLIPVNILYAGCSELGWSEGLWPHRGWFDFDFDAQDADGSYQITDIGDELVVGTFIHETAHLLCGWPDFYTYETGGLLNTSLFDNMWFGTQHISGVVKDPQAPSPLCLDWMGWLDKTDITNLKDGETVTLRNKVGDAAVYYKSDSERQNECYYFEVRRYGSADGIFVWHVNYEGDNEKAYECHDLRMEDCRPAYRCYPCFSKDVKSEFNDNSEPSAKWNDGTLSGIDIWDISEAGDVMSFRCGRKAGEPKLELQDSLVEFEGQYFETQLLGFDAVAVDGLHFGLVGGELPRGVSMDSSGVISGTPAMEGEYKAIVEAYISNDTVAKDTLTIDVRPLNDLVEGNVAHKIPGAIQFKDFMKGVEGVAFHDRTDNDVDSVAFLYYNCILMEQGEWLRYFVDVEEDGMYKMVVNYVGDASDYGKNYQIYIDDSLLVDYKYKFDFSGSYADCDRYGFIVDNFSFFERNIHTVNLTKGEHVLKVLAKQNVSFESIFFEKETDVENETLVGIYGFCISLNEAECIRDLNGLLTEHLESCDLQLYRPGEFCSHMLDEDFKKYKGIWFAVDYKINVKKGGKYEIICSEEDLENIEFMLDGNPIEVDFDLTIDLPEGVHVLTCNTLDEFCFAPFDVEPIVYPNPSNDYFQVVLPKGTSMTVFDLNGFVVIEDFNYNGDGGIMYYSFGEDLPRGIYIVRISKGGDVFSKKIVKL